MRRITLAAAFLGMASVAAFADVSKENIKTLQKANVSEEVILSYIKANGPIIKLSADDLVELRQAGVSDKVLQAMAGGSPGETAPGRVSAANAAPPAAYVAPSYLSEDPYYGSSYNNYSYPRTYSGYYNYGGYYSPSHSYPRHYDNSHHGNSLLSYEHRTSSGHSVGGHRSGGHSGAHSGGHRGGGHR